MGDHAVVGADSEAVDMPRAVQHLERLGHLEPVLRERLVDSGFELAETMEVLHRGWNIDGMSVRPDHRMVAHTGFLTNARLLPSA